VERFVGVKFQIDLNHELARIIDFPVKFIGGVVEIESGAVRSHGICDTISLTDNAIVSTLRIDNGEGSERIRKITYPLADCRLSSCNGRLVIAPFGENESVFFFSKK
jgi:hypothetical protein